MIKDDNMRAKNKQKNKQKNKPEKKKISWDEYKKLNP